MNASAVASTATRRNAGTGSRFPFNSSGSTASTITASRTSDSVAAPIRISPGGAACSSRAATLTASPVTSVSPSPATTSPVLTPVRNESATDELLAERRQPLADLRHGPYRPQRVVLVRDGDAEHSHRRVADELLHRAAVPLHDPTDLLEVAAHRAPHRLGIKPLAECRRPGHVAEDDRHRLAHLSRRRGRLERRAATAAKPEPLRALQATNGARRHAPSYLSSDRRHLEVPVLRRKPTASSVRMRT